MRLRTRYALYCSAAILALSASVVLADQQIGNVVQRDYNGAQGQRVASANPDDLVFNHDVFAGETVHTPGTSTTVIRFQDQTQIQVGSDSSVVLDKFVYDPSTGNGDAAIKFGTGVFRFITGDIKNKDAVKLTTPTTSLTIRGTKFILAVASDGATTLGVIDGAVDVSPCNNGATVRENQGEAVRVTATCVATQVALGSVPTDEATDNDYQVSENHANPPSPNDNQGGPSNNDGSHGASSSSGGSSSGGSSSGGSSSGGSSSGGSSSGGSSSGGGSSGGGGGFGGGGGHTDH